MEGYHSWSYCQMHKKSHHMASLKLVGILDYKIIDIDKDTYELFISNNELNKLENFMQTNIALSAEIKSNLLSAGWPVNNIPDTAFYYGMKREEIEFLLGSQ